MEKAAGGKASRRYGGIRNRKRRAHCELQRVRLLCLLGLLFLSRPSRFRSGALDNTISEMRILETIKENNKSESVAYRKRVRIILVWCG